VSETRGQFGNSEEGERPPLVDVARGPVKEQPTEKT
jgi:hypothetical protein